MHHTGCDDRKDPTLLRDKARLHVAVQHCGN